MFARVPGRIGLVTAAIISSVMRGPLRRRGGCIDHRATDGAWASMMWLTSRRPHVRTVSGFVVVEHRVRARHVEGRLVVIAPSDGDLAVPCRPGCR